jgi:hypothetical protein
MTSGLYMITQETQMRLPRIFWYILPSQVLYTGLRQLNNLSDPKAL